MSDTKSTPVSHLQHKRFVVQALSALANSTQATLAARLSAAYHPDAVWRGSHPLNEVQGTSAIAATAWLPLITSFPDLERRDDLVLAGTYQGRHYVGAMGHHLGTFKRDFLGIAATGRAVFLRYGEMHELVDGRIAHSSVLIDLLDLMHQAHVWPLPPSLGVEGRWPAPIGCTGVLTLHDTDPTEGAANLAQTLAMHGTLGAYNAQATEGRDGLLNMPQKQHWHPKMMWCGPAGIGTTRGLEGFVDDHQLPFRRAFPTRLGGQHYVRMGDGAFSATGGWPSVTTRHEGPFLGGGPTGREVAMRVMDFYHHDEGLIRENWVPIDIIHLLLQMDIDVFARMQSCPRRGAFA